MAMLENDSESDSEIESVNMDFSALNPHSTNALNLAARSNDIVNVKRLLTTKNPNCIDNRGWTCLHEAAASDSYACLLLILQHPETRYLATSHEGHTALYLACRFQKSLRTIKTLLDYIPDIVLCGSTENVTPLHIASSQGRTDCMELLIRYGALVDAQDFDGDTPLHDAAGSKQPEAIEVLLNARANPEIRNEANYTPFHLACYKGCFQSVIHLIPYMTAIKAVTSEGNSALHLATMGGNDKVVRFLLQHHADPNDKNLQGDLPLTIAVSMGFSEIFKILIEITNFEYINKDIILMACKPNYFKFDITGMLLKCLGPEFFKFDEPFFLKLDRIGDYELNYKTQSPLNIYFNIAEYVYETSYDNFLTYFNAFFENGLQANALNADECPPLVSIHLHDHEKCFEEVFRILIENDCNVDYCSSTNCVVTNVWIPDAFLVSLLYDPRSLPMMLPYSLMCEPEFLLNFAYDNKISNRISLKVQEQLLGMTGLENPTIPITSVRNTVFPLKHLVRIKIRYLLKKRKNCARLSNQFLEDLKLLKLPELLKNYLRYH